MAIRIPDRHAFAITPRVIMCGSRTSTKQEDEILAGIIVSRLEVIPKNWTIVVGYDPKKGTPRGADKIVYREAKKMGFNVENHPADWDRYKKGAGAVRNNKMARSGAQKCIAFWDGESPGTKDMIDRAHYHNIPVEVVPWTRRKKPKPVSTPSKSEG